MNVGHAVMATLIRHLRTICRSNHLTSIVCQVFHRTPFAGIDFLIADHKHLHLDVRRGTQPRVSLLRHNRETKSRADFLVSR